MEHIPIRKANRVCGRVGCLRGTAKCLLVNLPFLLTPQLAAKDQNPSDLRHFRLASPSTAAQVFPPQGGRGSGTFLKGDEKKRILFEGSKRDCYLEMMTYDDAVKLLFGPYKSPALQRGDRTVCLVRDCDVVITSWTNARIPWPRCRVADGPGGGSGLLVDEELARAIRNESALAIKYWWGVTHGTLWWWRRTLGVARDDPEGSKRLIQAAANAGADKQRGVKLLDEEIERRRQTAIALNLKQYLRPGGKNPWTVEQLALLHDHSDEEVAALTGRSVTAIRVKRWRVFGTQSGLHDHPDDEVRVNLQGSDSSNAEPRHC